MESRSYKLYIAQLFLDNFDCFSFSPENAGKLFELFKKTFYQDTPYWKEVTIDNNVFYIEFKKYGENRKRIFLKFTFISDTKSPRTIGLALTDEELKPIDETTEISLSDIWRDHETLIAQLKNHVAKGLDLAAEVNN